MSKGQKKQRFILLIGLLLALGLFSASSQASVDQKILIYVDGIKVGFPDQKPYIDKNDRTLVPVRFVSETLGAKVNWDGKAKKVSVKDEAKQKDIKLWVNKKNYTLNGETKTMDTVAVLTKQARVVVPMRFISEGLGAEVRWEVVLGNDVVHSFTLGQSESEIKEIMDKVKQEIENPNQNVTEIPDEKWSYEKPEIRDGFTYYFSEPDVKIAYATVDQLPIKTEKYTIKKIELTPTHIVISYDTQRKVTPNLYITKNDYLWVRGSYLDGQTSIVYKYPIVAYGNDDNPLSYEKLKTIDYLNICLSDTILAITNPWKEGN